MPSSLLYAVTADGLDGGEGRRKESGFEAKQTQAKGGVVSANGGVVSDGMRVGNRFQSLVKYCSEISWIVGRFTSALTFENDCVLSSASKGTNGEATRAGMQTGN